MPDTLAAIQNLSVWAVLALIVVVALVLHWVLHSLVLGRLRALAEATATEWPRVLVGRRVFDRAALTLQGIVVLAQARVWLAPGEVVRAVLEVGAKAWIVLFATLTAFALLDGIGDFVRSTERGRQLPLRGIFQSIKLAGAIMAGVLIVSALIGQSPLILLSGLGAMTAVLMLVFKDPIMGLVAGIQLSVNDMLRVGDWLEMPKYGADGDVIDIGLTTVKVRNWDNTITTIPTYALIADSFKNWRGMSESGGRRIKRAVMIDATSVRFLERADLEHLHRSRLLAEYLETKLNEIEQYNRELGVDLSTPIDGRRLTNIGTFRAYLTAYLLAHPKIHKGMTLMVRQLAPSADGIPMELYCFTNTTRWIEYESIQSDIFDHIFAVLPEFGLRMHQSPTGYDMRQIGRIPETRS